jgi:hypothetical protein
MYVDRTALPELAMRLRTRGLLVGFILLTIPATYFVVRDARGKSLGKALTGVTAFNVPKRRRTNALDSVLRNLPFATLAIPLVGWILFSLVSFTAFVQLLAGRHQRIGDGIPGTTVVIDWEKEV